MKSHSSKPVDCETVLRAVRRVLKAADGKHVSQAAFLAASDLNRRDLERHFLRWKDVLNAAGFDFKYFNAPVESDELLADWGSVVSKLQRLPSMKEYEFEGNHAYVTLQRRFGGWPNVPKAFQAFADDKPEWVEVRKLISTLPTPSPTRIFAEKKPEWVKTPWLTRSARGRKKLQQPLYGTPLDFGIFRYAPTSESGVILVFGYIAERLGFLIETVQPVFPDCRALRRAGPEIWESVRIEFELESRNFRLHQHDPKACDLIVCWEHNWPECPVEVLALKDEIKRLQTDAAHTN